MPVRRAGFTIKMSQDEYERLKAYAASVDRTATDILRSYIRSLPAPDKAKQEQGDEQQ